MTGKEIFRKWAPLGVKWSNWVRPVPFIIINENFKSYDVLKFTDYDIDYIDENTKNTAIIVDLPGNDSIEEGIALARKGFRPIPVYNGTIEQESSKATTDNTSIISGLIYGAEELEKIHLENDAMPAFLLDSNRTNRFKTDVSIFDNSWDIYDQDIPSEEFFLKNDINKIIVRGNRFQKDLKKVLYKFQKAGIAIFFANGYEESKKVTIKKPLVKDK